MSNVSSRITPLEPRSLNYSEIVKLSAFIASTLLQRDLSDAEVIKDYSALGFAEFSVERALIHAKRRIAN
jgi:hypothetical protein